LFPSLVVKVNDKRSVFDPGFGSGYIAYFVFFPQAVRVAKGFYTTFRTYTGSCEYNNFFHNLSYTRIVKFSELAER
jgi:hypothetical protein